MRSASFPLPTMIELFKNSNVGGTLGVSDVIVPHASGRTMEEEENSTGPEECSREFEESEGDADITGVEEDSGVVERGLTNAWIEGELIGVKSDGIFLVFECVVEEFSAVFGVLNVKGTFGVEVFVLLVGVFEREGVTRSLLGDVDGGVDGVSADTLGKVGERGFEAITPEFLATLEK